MEDTKEQVELLRCIIYTMISKINDRCILVKIYTFIKYL